MSRPQVVHALPERSLSLPAKEVRADHRGGVAASDGRAVSLVALVGAVAWLVVFYPGFMSADSAGQLMDARGGVYSNGHPPLTAALWAMLDRVVPGPAGMLFLQTALFWTGLAMVTLQVRAPVSLQAAFLLLVGWAPPVVSIAGALWKDVLMTTFLLLAFGFAARGRWFWLFALAATMTRHNAILAAAGAVLLRFWTPRPSVAGGARAVVATVVLLVTAQGINAALIDRTSHPVQIVALFDVVGAAAVRGVIPELPECYLRDGVVDTADVTRSYDPRSIGYLVSSTAAFRYCFDDDAARSLTRTWLSVMVSDPAAYLTHRLKVFGHLLGVYDTPGNYIMTRSTYDRRDHPGIELPPEQSELQLAFEQILLSMKPWGLFRPWVYGLLAVAACAIALWRRLWWPFCIAFSGVTYEAAMLVLTPSEDYRYSLWMIVAALIAAGWVVIEALADRSRTVRVS